MFISRKQNAEKSLTDMKPFKGKILNILQESDDTLSRLSNSLNTIKGNNRCLIYESYETLINVTKPPYWSTLQLLTYSSNRNLDRTATYV
jgi:hypothetical protein